MRGAELAGGFAVVAHSRVRVFEQRDTMLVGWGASGRGLARGTRDGRRAETWRRPTCGTRASPRRLAAEGWFQARELRVIVEASEALRALARDFEHEGRERRGLCRLAASLTD